MLSEGLKTEIEFCRDFAPDLTGLAYTAPPDLLVGMAGKLAAPVPKNLTPSALRASALEHRPFGLRSILRALGFLERCTNVSNLTILTFTVALY